ncbi:MAG TPA: hypothetical protein VKG65_09320 [Terriglobales bacterium]|nr:hypothetical protein [Terriglobales bacterium]
MTVTLVDQSGGIGKTTLELHLGLPARDPDPKKFACASLIPGCLQP